jgi:Carboxypeptidase regulatory-like domain
MSLRLRVAVLLMFFVALLPLGAAAQQTPASGATVHGMVVDPDDALIPGATVTLTPATGKAQITPSKSDGTYTFRGVAPGTYTVSVTAPGFATFLKQSVTVTTGASVDVEVSMALEDATQTVNVTTDAVQLSVDPENNASSTVISGDALQALSDDPDELATELAALAGPSAGPNGGQIYIDGFTGGQLPPKSSILAIRINSNPFSAQYDQLGYGRIEIITKPGTDKFHGSGSAQFQDKVLNTSTPFLGAANSQPNYYTTFGMGSLTGPIRTGMSFTLSGSYRDIQSNSIINPSAIYSSSPASTTMCLPNTAGCTSNPYPTTARAAAAPQKRWEINPRVDTLIGQKNTLTTRFEYESGSSTNNGGNTSLPTKGNTSSSAETTIQISDTQLLSSSVINETRFEFQRDTNQSSPFNPGTAVSVQGIVGAFGTGGGSINSDVQNHIEVQNYTSVQLLKNFVRLGGRLRTSSESNSSNGGQNGSLQYSFLLDPCADVTVTNKPSNCAAGVTTPCASVNTAPGVNISSYQCGIPFQFTQTTINQLTINARQTDVGLYAEDDWKVTPNFTWSYGVRLEAQNYINSSHDFAPRTSIAWGVPRKNGKTTTVLRGGFGIFYNRFGLGEIANLIQNNPANQTNLLFTYPGVGCTITSADTATAGCTAGTGTASGKSQVPVAGPGLRSAYTIESAATIEQQVGKYASVSVTYTNARGEHQFLTRTFLNSSGSCPTSITSAYYIGCNQSEGVFRQNQITANINVRTPKGTSIFGYYSANWADSNLSGITDPYHPAFDYGRAGFATRSRVSLGGTIPLPFLITASPLLFVNSGSPYNITTGQDNNGDGVVDDRPAFASGITSANADCKNANDFFSPPPSATYTTGESYTEMPVNFCTGPANVSVNLRLSRTFGFGPKTEASSGRGQGGQNGQNGQGGPGGGGPGGGGPGGGGPGGGGGFGGGGGGGGRGGGGGGGGGGRGGGGGGGGRSGSNTGRKYNLTIGAQALNLFNEVPYGSPVSSLSNPLFGKTISLGGGQFSGSNAVRRITLQANFYF